ncbi:MAG: aspartate aminotransferase family protein [Opitutales bacterium]
MPHHPSLIKNYAAPPFEAVRGEGLYLYDATGTAYLDFGSGIAVTAVGHSHPTWVAAMQKQTAELVHCSNLYGIAGQKRLADRLVEKIGPGRTLFCNSGAEANEALLKLARLCGAKRNADPAQPNPYKVVTALNSFHGRTFGGMTATPQAKIQNGFHPMLPGFAHAELNNIDSFAAAIDTDTAAVFIESIQGEGGIYPAENSFLQELRALCDERQVLLMLDEVQCGIGRTGEFLAYQASGIQPDAVGMAKGLGGGFPIGAIWVAEAHAEAFQPGSHGTTFGGSPLAACAANTVLDIIEQTKLLEKVQRQSIAWHQALQELASQFPDSIKTVRGRGYMVGLELRISNLEVTQLAREKGLLIVPAGNNTIRLLPALIAEPEQLAESVRILEQVFQQIHVNSST